MRGVALRGAFVVVTAILLSVGLLFTVLHKRRLEAGSLLHAVERLEASTSSSELHALETRFKEFLSHDKCASDPCPIVFIFHNSPLSELRLSHPVRLIVAITSDQSQLREISISYSLLVVSEAASNVRVTKLINVERSPAFEVRRYPVVGKPPSITLTIASNASQAEKDIAFSLNLRCLSSVPGCDGLDELAPKFAGFEVPTQITIRTGGWHSLRLSSALFP